ncbi:MAG: class I SAM-dependent methyltransferase [Planctomycetota bacterium]
MSPLTDEMLARCETALREVTAMAGSASGVAARVRQLAGEEFVGLVVATASLQPKAIAKLGPGLWWTTDRALQQASARPVSDCKANWFGGERVYDLCCGIGGDALALARRGEVIGVDRDLGLIAMARENVRMNSPHASRCGFICADVTVFDASADALFHIDPDRRQGNSRQTRPEDYSPSWEFVEQAIDQSAGVAVKLAPVAEVADRKGQLRVWISLAGSVREQTLLTGAVDRRARETLSIDPASHRGAIVLGNDAEVTMFSANVEENCEQSQTPSEYLIDPDAAIRAAGLTTSFANRFGLASIGNPSGFLTGNEAVPMGLGISERVLWHGSCDDRKLRKVLRGLNVFPTRVKTRGVAHDANQLQLRYRDCGETPVSLWIGRTSKRFYAAVTSTN